MIAWRHSTPNLTQIKAQWTFDTSSVEVKHRRTKESLGSDDQPLPYGLGLVSGAELLLIVRGREAKAEGGYFSVDFILANG